MSIFTGIGATRLWPQDTAQGVLGIRIVISLGTLSLEHLNLSLVMTYLCTSTHLPYSNLGPDSSPDISLPWIRCSLLGLGDSQHTQG
jgi:hypothetical protein